MWVSVLASISLEQRSWIFQNPLKNSFTEWKSKTSCVQLVFTQTHWAFQRFSPLPFLLKSHSAFSNAPQRLYGLNHRGPNQCQRLKKFISDGCVSQPPPPPRPSLVPPQRRVPPFISASYGAISPFHIIIPFNCQKKSQTFSHAPPTLFSYQTNMNVLSKMKPPRIAG